MIPNLASVGNHCELICISPMSMDWVRAECARFTASAVIEDSVLAMARSSRASTWYAWAAASKHLSKRAPLTADAFATLPTNAVNRLSAMSKSDNVEQISVARNRRALRATRSTTTPHSILDLSTQVMSMSAGVLPVTAIASSLLLTCAQFLLRNSECRDKTLLAIMVNLQDARRVRPVCGVVACADQLYELLRQICNWAAAANVVVLVAVEQVLDEGDER